MNLILDYLHQFNLTSVILRLYLALLFGGVIGLEQSRKGRAAGFRTYMLVCLGAAVTIMLGQYNDVMRATVWSGMNSAGITADVTRFGAQVINGIGFLGAGTILVTDKQQVLGLTTAAGLWASACMGLAIGAGFYECVIMAFVLIFGCIKFFPLMENIIIKYAKNINIHMEFYSLDDFVTIIGYIKSLGVHIYEFDISHGNKEYGIRPSVNFSLRRPNDLAREMLIAELSKLDKVASIKEI